MQFVGGYHRLKEIAVPSVLGFPPHLITRKEEFYKEIYQQPKRLRKMETMLMVRLHVTYLLLIQPVKWIIRHVQALEWVLHHLQKKRAGREE